MFDLGKKDLEDAFNALNHNDYVIGPAYDGGYYLLGMKSYTDTVFRNKDWGKDSVFKETMQNLKNEKVFLLETKNDIDRFEDLKNNKAFQPYLKNI